MCIHPVQSGLQTGGTALERSPGISPRPLFPVGNPSIVGKVGYLGRAPRCPWPQRETGGGFCFLVGSPAVLLASQRSAFVFLAVWGDLFLRRVEESDLGRRLSSRRRDILLFHVGTFLGFVKTRRSPFGLYRSFSCRDEVGGISVAFIGDFAYGGSFWSVGFDRLGFGSSVFWGRLSFWAASAPQTEVLDS